MTAYIFIDTIFSNHLTFYAIMNQSCLLVLITITFFLPQHVFPQSQTEIAQAETITNEYFKANKSIYPKMVRFAFHSCVGPQGCNGCLNINHPDNKGLEAIFSDLNDLFNQVTGFSRADFYALAGVIVLDFVKPGSTENVKEYSFGRKDCSKSPFEDEFYNYPNPRKGWEHVEEIFVDEVPGGSVFGLTINETVALIGGAHSPQ